MFDRAHIYVLVLDELGRALSKGCFHSAYFILLPFLKSGVMYRTEECRPLETQRCQDLRRDMSIVDQNSIMIVYHVIEEKAAARGAPICI